MPANGFNVGRDVTLDIIDPAQGPLQFDILTDWQPEPFFTELTSKALSGRNRFADIPEGWNLRFSLDRGNSEVDDYFAAREDAYFNGQSLPLVTITELITNPDGTISEYQYTNISMRLQSGGSWKSDAIVVQQVSARAERRLKVQ